MKKLLSVVLFGLTALAFSQETGALGTKKDPIQAPQMSNAPLVDGGAFIQMAVALLVVFALVKWGLPALLGKLGKGVTGSGDGAIVIKESATSGPATIQIVEVRGRALLVGVTAQSVNLIADLTANTVTKSSEPAFFEVLDEKVATPKASADEELATLLKERSQVRAVVEPIDNTPEPAPAAAPQMSEEEDFAATLALLQSAKKKMESRQTQTDDRQARLNRLIG